MNQAQANGTAPAAALPLRVAGESRRVAPAAGIWLHRQGLVRKKVSGGPPWGPAPRPPGLGPEEIITTRDMVYVVMEQADGAAEMKYWAKAYMSAEKAREGVEYWASRVGVNQLYWDDGGFGAQVARSADDNTGGRSWIIVPLPIHPDHEPERTESPQPVQ